MPAHIIGFFFKNLKIEFSLTFYSKRLIEKLVFLKVQLPKGAKMSS